MVKSRKRIIFSFIFFWVPTIADKHQKYILLLIEQWWLLIKKFQENECINFKYCFVRLPNSAVVHSLVSRVANFLKDFQILLFAGKTKLYNTVLQNNVSFLTWLYNEKFLNKNQILSCNFTLFLITTTMSIWW